MKKTTTAFLLAALLLGSVLLCACESGNVSPSPSPAATLRPTTPATPAASPSAPAASPVTSASPATGTGDDVQVTPLEGFEEGKAVEQSKVPDVVKALKDKYPDATIKSITYAMNGVQQAYHVMLTNKDKSTTEIYVSPDGTITPYEAASSSASPSSKQ